MSKALNRARRLGAAVGTSQFDLAFRQRLLEFLHAFLGDFRLGESQIPELADSKIRDRKIGREEESHS